MYSSGRRKHWKLPLILSISIILISLGFMPFTVNSYANNTQKDIARAYDLRISGWTFPWDNSSFESLEEWERELDEVSPYWYYALENGTVIDSHNKTENLEFIDHCTENGVKIIPMISNNHDPDIIRSIINDSDVRSHHIQQLLDITLDNNYKGVDINYENIPTSLKDGFSDFIEELTERFHDNNKLVYVSVFPKVSDDEDREGPGAYDYDRLGETADSVRVMAYNLHWSSAPRAGPVTAFDWLETVIEYSVSSIPPHKISLGIPLFGYDWIVDRKSSALSIADNRSFSYIDNLLKDPGIHREWNGTSRTPYLRYSDPSGILHEIHYNDAESLLHELLLVRDYGISRISLWRLGNEDPMVMDYLKRIQKEGVSNLPPYVNIGHDQKTMKGTLVEIGPVRAYDVDGMVGSISWDLGDGLTSSLLEPVHTYQKGGSYSPKITVIDQQGLKVTKQKNILVAPFSSFNMSGHVSVGEELMFDAGSSWDLEKIVSYNWDMGDGTYYFHSGPRINHTFTFPDDFIVTLTVINSGGFTDKMEMVVNIPDEEDPYVSAGGDLIVWEDMEIFFDGRGSFDNSGNLELAWTFHDNTVVFGPTAFYNYSQPGSYTVVLTGTDPSGRTSFDSIIVRVKDRTPPIIITDYPERIVLGESILLNISGSTDNVGIENITWKLPSGRLEYEKEILNYTPQSAGIYHFTIDIMDGDGNWNSTTVKISVEDIEPPDVEMMIDPAPAVWNETYISKLEQSHMFDNRIRPDLLLVVNVTYRFLLTRMEDKSGIGYINWTFGDGGKAFGGSVYHNYSLPGEYILRLIVDDLYGNRFREDLTIVVVPTVNFTLNPVQTYQTVYENRTNSTDGDDEDHLPLIAGISAIVLILILIFVLVAMEVSSTSRTIFRDFKKEDDGL